MKNIVELRDDLAKIFDQLKAKEIEPEQASQLTNCAGKIIGTLRVEMEYSDRRKQRPDIQFLNVE